MDGRLCLRSCLRYGFGAVVDAALLLLLLPILFNAIPVTDAFRPAVGGRTSPLIALRPLRGRSLRQAPAATRIREGSDQVTYEDDGSDEANGGWDSSCRPTLYQEAERMVLASFCAYSLTQLRREAKAGCLNNNQKVIDLLGKGTVDQGKNIGRSLAVADILDIVNDNWDYLKGKYCEGLTGYSSVDAFRRIDARAQRLGKRHSITLEDFNDANEGRKLVYGVAIDRNEKRITLIFRGTYPEGTKDWSRNLQFDMRKCPTPPSILEGDERAPEYINIHRGFFEYMFDNKDNDPNFPKERYDEIVDNLRPLLKENPDYKLYITGHSLGGALGTLTAFYFAASVDPDVPKPVNIVTCGSPLVGDENFRAAHQILESKGLIRHLRITNYEDAIPKGWPFSIVDKKLYKHVGVNLELMGEKMPKYKIGYRRIWPGQLVLDDGVAFPKFTLDPGRVHGVSEYMKRLLEIGDDLSKHELEDFYRT